MNMLNEEALLPWCLAHLTLNRMKWVSPLMSVPIQCNEYGLRSYLKIGVVKRQKDRAISVETIRYWHNVPHGTHNVESVINFTLENARSNCDRWLTGLLDDEHKTFIIAKLEQILVDGLPLAAFHDLSGIAK